MQPVRFRIASKSYRSNSTLRNSLRSPQPLEEVKNFSSVQDSRFNEVMKVRQENQHLRLQLEETRKELIELDEFKQVMKQLKIEDLKSSDESHQVMNQGNIDVFQTKLIKILMAKISKQRRFIQRQTKLLQESRFLFYELKNFIDQLANQVFKQSDVNVVGQEILDSFEQELELKGRVKKGILNEKEISQYVDERQKYVSLKSLLQSFKSKEEKDLFIQEFNGMYMKVIDFEKQNLGFANMFDIARGRPGQRSIRDNTTENVSQQGEYYLRFKHPIREVVEKYGKQFQIRSTFTSFPMKERESIESFLSNIRMMANGIHKQFTQIDTFSLFQYNPFYFKESSNKLGLPIKLVEERWLLEQFYDNQNVLPVLSLNQLVNTADQLSKLLQCLLNQSIKPHYETLLFDSIQALITLGILVGDQSQTNQKIQILLDQQQQSYNQSQFTIIPDSLNYAFFYHQAYHSNANFMQKYNLLETLIPNDSLQMLNLLKNIKIAYELQYNLARLREIEIHYLKTKLNYLNQDLITFKTFVTQAKASLDQFHSAFNTKFNIIHQSLLLINDKITDKKAFKAFQLTFQKQLHQIQLIVPNLQDNSINLRYIEDQFNQKVDQLYHLFQLKQKQ